MASGGGEDGKASDVKLWDVLNGTERFTLKGHKAMVMSVAFSADGRLLASGDADGVIKIWEPTTGKELESRPAFSRGGGACSMMFSPDGNTLATGSDDG